MLDELGDACCACGQEVDALEAQHQELYAENRQLSKRQQTAVEEVCLHQEFHVMPSQNVAHLHAPQASISEGLKIYDMR